MKDQCIIYFQHRNDATSIVKICMENTSCRQEFSVKLDCPCNVMSLQYTITTNKKVKTKALVWTG